MMILINRRLNGRPYLLTLPSASSPPDDTGVATGTLGMTGGGGSSSGAAAMSQTFSLSNWAGSLSTGNHKRGVWFKRGDLPANHAPVITAGVGQFYAPIYWKDGSLKTARLLLRDASLASNASRNYNLTAASGPLPSGAKAVAGNVGLISALTNHDFKVSFVKVKTWDCASTTGNFTNLGSGAFTASSRSMLRLQPDGHY